MGFRNCVEQVRDDEWRGHGIDRQTPFALSLSKGACPMSPGARMDRCFDRLSTDGDSHHCSFHWKLMLFHPPDGVE